MRPSRVKLLGYHKFNNEVIEFTICSKFFLKVNSSLHEKCIPSASIDSLCQAIFRHSLVMCLFTPDHIRSVLLLFTSSLNIFERREAIGIIFM